MPAGKALRPIVGLLLVMSLCAAARGQTATTRATTEPAGADDGRGQLEHVQIDLRNKQIRVDCQALNVQMPLEFFCVRNGGPEHETVLRTQAKPSAIHFALLAMGLTPGTPAHYVESTKTWYPPTGPPLNIFCEFTADGKTVRVPAYRMMRSVKTHQEMPPMTWVFDGSRVLPGGQYAADITDYVVSIVNFDLTMIDVPELASNANETLQWEYNPEVVPKKGQNVTMIIEPAPATTRPAAGKPASEFNPGPGLLGGAGAKAR